MLLPFLRIVNRGAVLYGSVLVYDVREISDQSADRSIIISCIAAGVNEINIRRFVAVVRDSFSEDKCLENSSLILPACEKISFAAVFIVSSESCAALFKSF